MSLRPPDSARGGSQAHTPGLSVPCRGPSHPFPLPSSQAAEGIILFLARGLRSVPGRAGRLPARGQLTTAPVPSLLVRGLTYRRLHNPQPRPGLARCRPAGETVLCTQVEGPGAEVGTPGGGVTLILPDQVGGGGQVGPYKTDHPSPITAALCLSAAVLLRGGLLTLGSTSLFLFHHVGICTNGAKTMVAMKQEEVLIVSYPIWFMYIVLISRTPKWDAV
ncbi:uncharacterized protein LOC121499265 isoform X3 [Vulpes lagopus]|uniref:uncharacterized protein LOC121499265 isoform X3 n=1 Tax=Vulpes lagopus TaxID=494514 RepID=UPI001BC97340|nr:uncharacterized protein LOC121499265 isoform X3 [Vulpes lagopus]